MSATNALFLSLLSHLPHTQLREKLKQLTLSDAEIMRREQEREANGGKVPSPWLVLGERRCVFWMRPNNG